MKIILKHILRNIKEKKGRSLLIIISLMIASCVFILNLTIPNQILEANTQRMRDIVGKSDILVKSFENFNIDDLNLNGNEIKSVGVNQISLIHKDKTLILYGSNIYKAKELKLLNTDILLEENEIIINNNTAEKYNYKENDIIKIEIEENTYELKIKKILDNTGLLYFKTLSGFVNETTFKNITNQEHNKYNTYFIDVQNDEKINSVKNYIQDNNKNFMVEKLIDEEAIKENNSYTQMILLIIFVMSTIMIFFVVNALNKMIVLERMPVIGTFRSIGASKKKMNILLVLENIIYGLLGGTLGALVSLAINNLSVKLLLGGQDINTNMAVSKLFLGILFAIILEVVMSLGAIIKSNKYSIKNIMFDDKNAKYKVHIPGTVISIISIIISICIYLFANDNNMLINLTSLILFWIGIAYFIPFIMIILSKIICYMAKRVNNGSLLIASKNLGNNKLLIASTRLIVISIAIILVIINISSTFNKMLDSFSIQFAGYDLFIEGISKEYEEYYELLNLKNIEQIDNVFMYSSEEITFDGKKFDVAPMLLGMKNSRADIQELNYKISDLKKDEVLIDEIYLKNNNLKVGDKIKLDIKEKNISFDLKIVGTVNSFYQSIQREIIVLNEETFIDNISNVPFQINVKSNKNADLKIVIEDIEKQLKNADISIQTVDDFVTEQRSNINTIMSLFYIIIGLAITLVFVGIINNQLISFMERTRELAVLNSVCMSKFQIIKMLIIENILSNVSACIIGFLVAIMSVNLIGIVLNGMKMYIDLIFNFKIGFMVIGIILVLLLLTIILPIKKLKKINIVESIKYE